MYWILWYVLMIVSTALFSYFYLADLAIKAKRAIMGDMPFKTKLTRLIEVSLAFGFVVFWATFATATTVVRSRSGFVVGRTDVIAPFLTWPPAVLFGVAFITFIVLVVISRRRLDLNTAFAKTPEHRPQRDVRAAVRRVLPSAVCVLAAVATAIPVSFAADYVLIKLFSASAVKKIVLALVATEVVAVVIMLTCMRKRIPNLRKYARAATIALIAALVCCYVLLVALSADAVESVFVCLGSAIMTAIPLITAAIIVIYRVKEPCSFETVARKEIK